MALKFYDVLACITVWGPEDEAYRLVRAFVGSRRVSHEPVHESPSGSCRGTRAANFQDGVGDPETRRTGDPYDGDARLASGCCDRGDRVARRRPARRAAIHAKMVDCISHNPHLTDLKGWWEWRKRRTGPGVAFVFSCLPPDNTMRVAFALVTAVAVTCSCSKRENAPAPRSGGAPVSPPATAAVARVAAPTNAAPRQEPSTLQTAVDGFTGRTAVNAGRKAQDKIRGVVGERDADMKEVDAFGK